MNEKLKKLEEEYEQLLQKMSDPAVINNTSQFKASGIRKSEIEQAVFLFRSLRDAQKQVDEAQELLKSPDEEMRQMAKEELEAGRHSVVYLEEKLKYELLPKDPDDKKDCIMEVRAGAGGEDAALFAS